MAVEATVRRYDDPVEVRRGTGADGEGPEQFLWRGRLWKVRAVVARWVETGAWWHSDGVGPVPDAGRTEPGESGVAGADLLAERELWRVQAGRGGLEGDGVFDLSFDHHDGCWQLVACQD